jgi:hypothetical protein
MANNNKTLAAHHTARCLLQRLVYAHHGRELMGFTPPGREPPCPPWEDTARMIRGQLRQGDRPWRGRRSANRCAYEQQSPIRPTGRVRWHHAPKPPVQVRGYMRRLCSCRAPSSLGSPPDQALQGRRAARRDEGPEASAGTHGAAQATLLERMLSRDNMLRAWQRITVNQGAVGMDGLAIDAFPEFARHHGERRRAARDAAPLARQRGCG